MKRILLLTLISAQVVFAQPIKKDVSGTNSNPQNTNQTNLTCNNWLNLPSYQSYVTLGDLDIPGNTVTVEAVFVRTAPYSGGYNWAGDLVSKHIDPNDVNYLLRPNNAEITTSAGFFITPPICEIELNRTYHAAMVYDGSTLKFYRNGFLMSQVPASGNLIQNNHPARIGLYAGTAHNTNLIGQINEVRIWNVARTQDQIRTYLNSSLPNPTTQPGLLAYYTFDDLLNKQGNSIWNGILGGSAAINASVTNCNVVTDSCSIVAGIGNIINSYTPVIDFYPCENKIVVEDPSEFNIGDTVLMIQMKGAVIDSTNTISFGTITDYGNSGNYEFNYIKSITGNIIELKNILTRQYSVPDGKVQLIRVPYYQNATITSTLTCLPWDGSKGGVLVLNVRDTVTLNANIDVSGKGFRGGNDPYSNPSGFLCYENQFYYPPNQDLASEKGEGIAILSSDKSFGKGAISNGGGGGNSHNSGGGGGSNAANGGFGGYNFEGTPCTNTPFDNRGIGGKSLAYNNLLNKVFLGGGGGAGHTNNPQAFEAKGGNGGGIAILICDKIKTNGNKFLANGNNGYSCGSSGSLCHEGMGGGGAGGSILIMNNNYLDNSIIETRGGKGADMTAAGFLKVGPGGGGGGGILWVSNSTIPTQINYNGNGGVNGVTTAYGNLPFGATAGSNGISITGLQIPYDNTPFRPNIDSVRVKDSLLSCNSFDFKGLAYTNTHPVASWLWYFGDGGTANTQNPTYSYPIAGTYPVKLIVTDINGCKDSISINVTASLLTMDAGPADTICSASTVTLQANATGATQYSWSPASLVNNPSVLNPVASPSSSTTFYLTATNAAGCSQTDSVRIEVRSVNNFTVNPPVEVCQNSTIQLSASGGDVYNWTPASTLDNPSLANPIASPVTTTPYSVTITDTLCNNSSTLSTIVTVLPLPAVRASKSNDIDCSFPQSRLTATGATQYVWAPAASLDNPLLSSPVATPVVTTKYFVQGTDIDGCTNTDSVQVIVSATNKGRYLMPTVFTPNNDGLNDCYGIKYWGVIQELEFSIYNRWGERIFFTRNPGECWDGRYKGIPQDPAVFIYMIKARTTCENNIFRKGTFTLIR